VPYFQTKSQFSSPLPGPFVYPSPIRFSTPTCKREYTPHPAPPQIVRNNVNSECVGRGAHWQIMKCMPIKRLHISHFICVKIIHTCISNIFVIDLLLHLQGLLNPYAQKYRPSRPSVTSRLNEEKSNVIFWWMRKFRFLTVSMLHRPQLQNANLLSYAAACRIKQKKVRIKLYLHNVIFCCLEGIVCTL